jgi:hypothetical protein
MLDSDKRREGPHEAGFSERRVLCGAERAPAGPAENMETGCRGQRRWRLTLTRMMQGKRPDVDGLAALLKWSGLKAESFIDSTEGNRAETLAEMTALLRADPNLSDAGKLALEGVLRATYESLRTL